MTLPIKAADAQPAALEKAPATPTHNPVPCMKLQPVTPGSHALSVMTVEQAELETMTGAGDPSLALHWVNQATNAGGPATLPLDGPERKDALEARMGLVMASMHGIGPKDAVEGMLAAQMTALHDLAMVSMRHAARAAHPETLERAVRNATKLQGAFLAAVDGLKRWRGGTTVQRVVVERVTVEAGGQAVVGAVAAGGVRGGGDGHD